MNRERELKYDLGGEDLARRLEARLGPVSSACWQVNRFFDAPAGDLRRARLALRLRAEWPVEVDRRASDPQSRGARSDDAEPAAPELLAGPPPGLPARVLLTLKGPRQREGALHDRPEREQTLEIEAWSASILALDDLPAGWRELLPAEVAGQDLTEFIHFANLRRRFRLPPRWTAEVDRTRFPGGPAAWEVEVECGPGDEPAAVRRALESALAGAGIVPRPQERSKLERALAARGP